jgi:hypothetical protein
MLAEDAALSTLPNHYKHDAGTDWVTGYIVCYICFKQVSLYYDTSQANTSEISRMIDQSTQIVNLCFLTIEHGTVHSNAEVLLDVHAQKFHPTNL